MLAGDKRASLFSPIVSDEERQFYNVDTSPSMLGRQPFGPLQLMLTELEPEPYSWLI